MAEMTSRQHFLPTRSVALFLPPHSQLLGVLGLIEAFDAANRWLGSSGQPPLYDLHLLGLGEEVQGVAGTRLRTRPVGEAGPISERIHTLVVGGALDSPTEGPAVEAVARLAARAERVASICAGAFLLAGAGLLDGRRCTTHWLALDRLRAVAPTALVEDDAIYTEDGPILTSAGSSAGIDLALHLIRRDRSPRLALAVARSLVVFAHRPGGQSQFGSPIQLPAGVDSRLRSLALTVARQPAADHSVAALARRVHMSPRHFARVFRSQTGQSPAAWVRRTRVECAQRLLAADDPGLAEVAAATGLGSVDSLRRAFLAVTGVTPSEWRDRFGPRRTPHRPGEPRAH